MSQKGAYLIITDSSKIVVMKERDMFGKSVEVLHNENRKAMPVLSRSGGSSRFYSSGYICLESSKNFIGIIEAVARRCSRGKGVLRNFEKFLRTPPVAASRINS